MAEYKAGDRVLIEAVFDRAPCSDGLIQVVAPCHGINSHVKWRIRPEHFHGHAPRPETDWSKVEFGAKVRFQGDDALFVTSDDVGGRVQVLIKGFDRAHWCKTSHCELIEE